MTQPDTQLLDEIVGRIVAAADPDEIILFGGRARNDTSPQSDIDLLVTAESTEPRHRRSAPLYGALSDIMVPTDIVVYSPREIEEWSQVPQAFVTTAARQGRILYEKKS